MAQLLDYNASATFQKRDVSESFTLSRALEAPVSTMIKKGAKPKATLFEWPHRVPLTPSDVAIEDGTDLQAAEVVNNSANKAMIQGRTQLSRRGTGVGLIAQEAIVEYGEKGDDQLAQNREDMMNQSREDLEVTLLKNGDSVAAVSGTPGKTRGLVNWIRSANPGSPDLAVPTQALCAAGQIVTGKAAATDVTEDNVRAIMKTIATAKRVRSQTWDCFLTPAMKEVFSNWTRTGDTTASTVPLRRFNAAADTNKITLNVKFYESDFGLIRLHPHFSLPSGVHAVFADFGSMQWRPLIRPTMGKIPFQGGGYKEFVYWAGGLQVDDPQCFGKITT